MNIVLILGYLVLLFLTCIMYNGIYGFYMFYDEAVLLYTFLFILVTLLGTGMMKDFINGAKIIFRFKKSYSMLDLKKAEESFHLVTKSALLFGCISFVIGFLSMLYNISDPVALGPAMAGSLSSILYGLAVALILNPFKAKIHKLLIAYAEENETRNTELNEEALEQRVFYLFRSKGLTDREAEIARLITQELTNREIAGRLYISEATVKKHITHILEKLNLESREDLKSLIKE